MPWPPAIRRQEFLSLAEAWESRGYHSKGAAMLRPSANCTSSVSSLTSTCVASGVGLSAAKELIPYLQEVPLVFIHKLTQTADFISAKSVASLQLPILSFVCVPLFPSMPPQPF